MNLNKAMIIGNLTRDPEIRTTANGTNVASFGVATNHSWTDASGQKQDKAEFHNIVAWAKLADICGQFLAKGRKVYIEGRIQTREWDAQDGTKKSRTEIVAENMIMLDRGNGPTAGGAMASQPRAAASANAAPTYAPIPSEATDEVRVEDIPF